MDELIKLLTEIRDDVDYTSEKKLVSSGLFESFEILMCVSACEEAFEIEFPPEAILPDNFESAEALWNLITEIKNNS